MDQKTNLNRNNSYNFFSEHTTGILRKSLAHIRKPEDQHTFRRNNSLSRAINQNFSKPSIIAPMMIESTQAINRKPLPLHNEIDNSKMFTSAFSSNLTHKNIKIKLRKPSSITYLVQKNQPIDKNSPNTHHNPIIKTKGMIKIRSSERLKTPTKEERNSWNSKKNKDSPKNSFKNNINTQKPPSFFSIKSKPQTKIISRFSLDNTNIHDLELSEADSLIIEPEELEKTMKSLEKTQTILPKITKDSQIKINEKFNSIVDKAAKDNKKKRLVPEKNPRDKKNGEMKIEKEILVSIANTRVLSCQFNPQDNFLAIGGEDGITRIVTPIKKSDIITLSDNFCYNNPVNNVRWNPQDLTNRLLVTNSSGTVTLWDVSKKKIVQQIIESQSIFAADYNLDGTKFAIGGTDTTIKIYEETKNHPIITLNGHKNRVFAIKFHETNSNILLSGGWDETVLLWDLRVDSKQNPISYIYGPLICGEALDINGNYVLTGSWREKRQLEVWDLRKLYLIKGIDWIPQKPNDKSYIYSACFSKNSQRYIVAGGSGSNEIRVFKQNYDVNLNYECLEIIKDLKKSVYTLNFCHENNSFAWGDGSGDVGIVDIL